MALTDRRAAKMQAVVARRQPDLAVLLENVHDKHNIGAVLRSCDSVGIADVYVLYTMEGLDEKYFKAGQQASSGALKWVRLHFFRDRQTCFEILRSRYETILGTHLSAESSSLYELDLTQSTVLVFGNEHAGISEQTLAELDGNFVIPQVGMVESLNISVACAVSLYEASRQRIAVGSYDRADQDTVAYQAELSAYYREINKTRERHIFDPPKRLS